MILWVENVRNCIALRATFDTYADYDPGLRPSLLVTFNTLHTSLSIFDVAKQGRQKSRGPGQVAFASCSPGILVTMLGSILGSMAN